MPENSCLLGPDARLILVGYRASGKSVLGRACAASLGWSFADLDEEIERQHGRSIPELFASEGERWFRDVESGMLVTILQRPRQVVAPGGGVVLNQDNRRLLRAAGFVVYLRPPLEELLERLRDAPGRPALTDLPLEEEVRSLLSIREPLYREVADAILEVARGERPAETEARLYDLLGLPRQAP